MADDPDFDHLNIDHAQAAAYAGRILAGLRDDPVRQPSLAWAAEALRREPERVQALATLSAMLSLPAADPDLWVRWLRGGEPPFDKSILKRVSTGEESSSTQLKRSSDRIKTARGKAERARRALERAEQELQALEALDSNIVAYLGLVSVAAALDKMFAMGPAWTLMRVLSSEYPKTELERELQVTQPDSRAAKAVELRERRATETAQILAVLDIAAGDAKFERELRRAISSVCHRWRADNPLQATRSAEALKRSVRPDVLGDVRRIVESVQRRDVDLTVDPPASPF